MAKIIFVNATAATEGGALTILKQFFHGIDKYSNKDYIYYVFCSLEELKQYESPNIKIVTDIKGKKWLDRIKWDLFGLKTWSKKRQMKADLIISFQNTGCCYDKDTKQMVYIHQPLAFCSSKNYSFWRKRERKFWFYQHIYKKIIKHSLTANTFLVVQTETMKNAIIQQFKWPEDRIKLIRPNFEEIEIEKVNQINFNDNKFHIFYPATTYLYKNHEIIIQALKYLKDKNRDIYNNLAVHFTFKPEGARNLELVNLIEKLGVSDAIKLEGQLSYDKVLSFYKSCDLMVFPSYVESFPLPLLEAALFGLPVLVSDLPFSLEVLKDYPGGKFLDYTNSQVWAETIGEFYKKRTKFPSYRAWFSNSWPQFFEIICGFRQNNL